jgi:outer membrane lipoprotein SlyB
MLGSFKAATLAIGCAVVLGGCAYNYGANEYRGYEARGEQSVRFGVVESTRPVRIQPVETGLGAASGAVIGGIAGSNVGGGTGQIVGGIAGAILGGVIGQNVERQANEVPGIEITVLLDSGKYISVVQQGDEAFRQGDRVRILTGHNSTRVTH